MFETSVFSDLQPERQKGDLSARGDDEEQLQA